MPAADDLNHNDVAGSSDVVLYVRRSGLRRARAAPGGLVVFAWRSCWCRLLSGRRDLRRAYKENIHYLNDADLERLHEELMRFRLATYQYQGAPSERHLGFVIEDIEPSAAVESGRNMVDLYGYTSMTVAALQSQAREIKVLKKEVVRLRRALQARDGAGRSTGFGSRR